MPARKRKAPPGCYWRENTLWGRAKVSGKDIRWSLDTDDPAIAKTRRKAGRARAIADVRHGDAERSFGEVFASWDAQIEKSVGIKTADRYRCSLEQIAPHLEGKSFRDIDGKLVGDIIEARQKADASNATIRRDMTALGSVIKYGRLRGWRDDDPVRDKLELIPERRDPIVLPLDRDIDLVVSRATPMVGAMVRAAMAIGAREDELLKAIRDHIDHARRQLTIVGKRNRLRVIELDPYGGYTLLTSLPAYAGKAHLFWHGDGQHYSGKSFAGNFHRLVEQTAAWAAENEVPFRPFTFHHLRHRHAVDFLKDRIGGIYDLQRRLGHTSVKATEVYLAYLTPEEVQAAMFGAGAPVAQKAAQPTAGGTVKRA
jgi:integrase/recombinase XerD